MPEKEKQIDVELQKRVLDAMFVFSDLGDGVVKCTIPDDLFTKSGNVKVDGKEYGIYDIPGMVGRHGGSGIIERAIEKFVVGHGAPSWSQIVTAEVEDEIFHQLVQYPKTVYLKK